MKNTTVRGRTIALTSTTVVGFALISGCASDNGAATPSTAASTSAQLSSDASPRDVAQYYVAAVNSHDTDALSSVVVASFKSQASTLPTNFFGSAKLGETVDDDSTGDGTAYQGQDTAMVPISFDDDGSQKTWGILLVKMDGHWAVFDQGNG